MPAMIINRLDISGKRDVVIGEYCTWQQKQVASKEQKEDYQRAFDYLLDEGLDLELIYQDQSVAHDLRTKAGVKRGVALRVLGDVGHWAKKRLSQRPGATLNGRVHCGGAARFSWEKHCV